MMKKLTNVSPFLLLLFPVFIMMVFAFTNNNQVQDEAVAKTTTSNSIFKVNASVIK